jgi:hypothetical protein
MVVAIYYDEDRFELKYFDEIEHLEKGLQKAGHQIVRIGYDWLKRSKMSYLNKENPEVNADAYVLTPGGALAKDKFLQHLGLKTAGYHKKPIVLYDFDEDFTQISMTMLRWCGDNDVRPGDAQRCFSITTSVHETVNSLYFHG